MADQRKYTAQLARKGLDATGVTEDHARSMAANLGGHTMLIVEARHAQVVTDAEGNQQVKLTATNVEPVPVELEEKVREVQRALYLQRPDQEGQAALKGTADQRTPKEAVADLSAEVEHDAEGNVVGIWDGSTDGPLTDDADGRPWPGDEPDDDSADTE